MIIIIIIIIMMMIMTMIMITTVVIITMPVSEEPLAGSWARSGDVREAAS